MNAIPVSILDCTPSSCSNAFRSCGKNGSISARNQDNDTGSNRISSAKPHVHFTHRIEEVLCKRGVNELVVDVEDEEKLMSLLHQML